MGTGHLNGIDHSWHGFTTPTLSATNHCDAFRDAIAHSGLTPPDSITADGELHRFSSNGKRGDDAGWYVFHSDEVPSGIYGDWRTGLEGNWRADIGRRLSVPEITAVKDRERAARRKRELDTELRQTQACAAALAIWKSAGPAPADHPYLSKKGIAACGVRLYEGDDRTIAGRSCAGALIIPMREASGGLCSLQFIAADGEKRFLPGGRLNGCYFAIGEPSDVLHIVEGFATGASVHEATGQAIAVAFNAGNLLPVARAMRAKFPQMTLIVCADDDYRTEGNPGVTKATEAARAVSGLIAVPDFDESRADGATDFNDMARARGNEAVERALRDAVRPDVPTQAAPAASAMEPGCAVHFIRGDSVRPEAIDWLWDGFLAAGKLHVVAGAPGTGKTTLALALAATVTVGGRWPDGTGAVQGDVLIWSGEDGIADTLIPRLHATGADMTRVHLVGDVSGLSNKRPFDPAQDFPLLELEVARIGGVRLLIVDPVVSAVGGDSHKNGEVRRALQPLVDFAARAGCAVLGISHFSKGTQGRDPLERVTGSIAFGAVARIVLATAKLPEDEGGGRVLVRSKSNIGPDGGGFKYELRQEELGGEYGGIIASRVEWSGPVAGTAKEILATAERDMDPDEKSELHDAGEWLRSTIDAAGGQMNRQDVLSAAKKAGYSERTTQRAKDRAGVKVHLSGFGENKKSVWQIVHADPYAPIEPTMPAEKDGMNGTNGRHESEGETF